MSLTHDKGLPGIAYKKINKNNNNNTMHYIKVQFEVAKTKK